MASGSDENEKKRASVSFNEEVTKIEPEPGDGTELEKDREMEWLKKYFAKSLGIFFDPRPEELIEQPPTFEGIAKYMASDKCKKIVTLVGAGISTAAGIPDYRSPNTGLLDTLKAKYDLPDPKAVFELEYFKTNPEPFYKFRQDMWSEDFKPTAAHYFIKMLEDKGKLLRHFTQNIDGLERMVGIQSENMIEVHGSMDEGICQKCHQPYTKADMKELMFGVPGEDVVVPHCTEAGCDGVIRPAIVFFGEQLPWEFKAHIKDLEDCDMLLILGTSLKVQPFANLPVRVPDNVPRLYVSIEETKASNSHPMSVLFFGGGFKFGLEDNTRDVFWQGKCDDFCYALSDLIGWGEEFRSLVVSENVKYDIEVQPLPLGEYTKEKIKAREESKKAASRPGLAGRSVVRPAGKAVVGPAGKTVAGPAGKTVAGVSSKTKVTPPKPGVAKPTPAASKSSSLTTAKKAGPAARNTTGVAGGKTKAGPAKSSSTKVAGKASPVEETKDCTDTVEPVETTNPEPKPFQPESDVDYLERIFCQNNNGDDVKPECLMEEVSFEGLVKYMKSKMCKKIVTMVGAGISTAAGIPDYRSPKTGLLDSLKDKYNLPNPQAVFDINYFKKDPAPFYMFRKDMWSLDYKPTAAHYFIKLLEQKKLLSRHFTQNIDGLERMCGLSEEKLTEVHGTMDKGYCLNCHAKYNKTDMKKQIMKGGEEGLVPYCTASECKGVIRPDIVFFGEQLANTFQEKIKDVQDCDLLIVMGTALAVQPFANLPTRAQNNVPRLFINLEKPSATATSLFLGPQFLFDDPERNVRDIFWQGKCDDGCYALADKLGWGSEYRSLVKSSSAKLGVKNVSQPKVGSCRPDSSKPGPSKP